MLRDSAQVPWDGASGDTERRRLRYHAQGAPYGLSRSLGCVTQHAGFASQQRGQQQQQPAPKVAPPEDPELRRTIEAMAPFVARNGPAFEALATKLNASNPMFCFLSGGRGAEYYRWRVQVGTWPNRTTQERVGKRSASVVVIRVS